MRHVVVLFVMGIAVATAPTVKTTASLEVIPQRKWLEIRSANFTVVGEVGARELRQVAERMEQLHEVLMTLSSRSDVRAPDTTVIVFPDRRRYRPFQPRYQDKPVDVAGYFQPGPMNYITVLAEPGLDYRSVVYHEYVHLATRTALGRIPLWTSEGLAEFYSTFEIAGGRTARLGGMLQEHIWRLQKEFLPLTALAHTGHDSPYYNERDKSSVFYAESWAFVHFLRLGMEQKYAAKVGPFLDAVVGGADFETACVEHLGSTPAVLEQELRQYLYSPVFFRMDVKLTERVERIARIEPTPVPEAAAHATLGHLLELLGRSDEAREHLEHAVRVDASQPMALALMADMAAEAGRAEQAGELASRAGRATNQSYLSHFYRASALERRQDTTPEASSAIESALRQSVELNPWFAEAHARLAQERAGTPDGLDEARRLQARAIALAPARDDYVLGLARVIILQGDTRTARSLLGPLLARGSTPEIRKIAREFLGVAARIDAAAAAPGASSTVIPPLPQVPDAAAPGESPGGIGSPRTVPDLRAVQDGETRILGRLTAIDCGPAGVVIAIESDTGVVRVRGPEIGQITFISYREDLSGAISCGTQPTAHPVLATYRPEASAGAAGTVVAIEFVPPGYRPPGV